jgi:dUTP pyrophosphatase
MDIQNSFNQGGNVPLKVMLTREFKFLKMINPQMDIDLKPATEGSAGIDLFACIEKQICLNRMGEREVIPTGIHIELPLYWEGQVRPRSGLAAKSGIAVTNSPGTIDSDYRGEIKVILHNTSTKKFWVRPGDRIAQLVLKPVWLPVIEYVDELSDTDRGEGGFGHTGS